jgi:hypothetical protein
MVVNIPKELINIILEYDGRIKYRKGTYVNIIHKHDFRYVIINQIIIKKIQIIKNMEIQAQRFYCEFGFDKDERIGLCFDYNWSFGDDTFEICYYDLRDKLIQIRTIIK